YTLREYNKNCMDALRSPLVPMIAEVSPECGGGSVSTLSYTAIISERNTTGRSSTDLTLVRAKFVVRDLSFWYGKTQALFNISLTIPENSVCALIGPSGCGKSTFIRVLNRMNDLIENTRHVGQVELDGEEIHGPDVNLAGLRRRVGMVFQKSNPFPK